MLLPDVCVLRQEETWRLAAAAGDVKGNYTCGCVDVTTVRVLPTRGT